MINQPILSFRFNMDDLKKVCLDEVPDETTKEFGDPKRGFGPAKSPDFGDLIIEKSSYDYEGEKTPIVTIKIADCFSARIAPLKRNPGMFRIDYSNGMTFPKAAHREKIIKNFKRIDMGSYAGKIGDAYYTQQNIIFMLEHTPESERVCVSFRGSDIDELLKLEKIQPAKIFIVDIHNVDMDKINIAIEKIMSVPGLEGLKINFFTPSEENYFKFRVHNIPATLKKFVLGNITKIYDDHVEMFISRLGEMFTFPASVESVIIFDRKII